MRRYLVAAIVDVTCGISQTGLNINQTGFVFQSSPMVMLRVHMYVAIDILKYLFFAGLDDETMTPCPFWPHSISAA